MKTKSRGWGNMTKKQRVVEMARRRAVAKSHKNPAPPSCPPPENPSLLGQASPSEYSAQQHVYDLENKNRNLRNFAAEVIAEVLQIAMRQIR